MIRTKITFERFFVIPGNQNKMRVILEGIIIDKFCTEKYLVLLDGPSAAKVEDLMDDKYRGEGKNTVLINASSVIQTILEE